MAAEGRCESRDWKFNNISKRSGITTKYCATKINKTETDSKCRLCKQSDETVEHTITACPIMAKEQYIKRRDRVCVLNCSLTYSRKLG